MFLLLVMPVAIAAGAYFICKEIHIMAGAIDRLRTEVEEMRSVQESAVALLGTLAQEIRDNVGNEAELNALADEIDARTNELAAAVTANTPADGEEPTEPTEPTPDQPQQ